jgi:thiamine-triphosphatase
MIEVEKTLPFDDAARTRLTHGAEFLHETTLVDTYYDHADLRLTTSDRWLRERNGQFELKLPVRGGSRGPADRYEELETDGEIARALGLLEAGTLRKNLAAAGYLPFGTITTTRTAYRKDGFTLDFDATDSGFTAVEIELMVNDAAETETAAQKILAFANAHGLEDTLPNGKVVEYIRARRPAHFAALQKAGVVR